MPVVGPLERVNFHARRRCPGYFEERAASLLTVNAGSHGLNASPPRRISHRVVTHRLERGVSGYSGEQFARSIGLEACSLMIELE